MPLKQDEVLDFLPSLARSIQRVDLRVDIMVDLKMILVLILSALFIWYCIPFRKTQHEKNMIGIGVGIFVLMKSDSNI